MDTAKLGALSIIEDKVQATGGRMVYEHLPVVLPVSEQIQGNPEVWWQNSSVARILHLAFTRYSHAITFGPCKGGSVFELRLPEVPTVSFPPREILIDLPKEAGHFHLVLLPPGKGSVAPASQYAARLALFHGSQPHGCADTSGKPAVYGFRLWSQHDDQLLTLFFLDWYQWQFFRSEVFELVKEPETIGTKTCRTILPNAEAASWSLDSVPARIDFYQRLLYSPAFEQRARAVQALLPERTRKILQRLPQGLEQERNARHRNLIFTLKRTASFSLLLLTDEEAATLVGEWCDSDVFWKKSARSLPESFCLFAWQKLRFNSPLTAELIHLQGVMSGITHANADTPWLEHRLNRQEHVHEESWLSAVAIVDEDGSVVFDADESLVEPCCRIYVRHDRGKIRLRAEKL